MNTTNQESVNDPVFQSCKKFVHLMKTRSQKDRQTNWDQIKKQVMLSNISLAFFLILCITCFMNNWTHALAFFSAFIIMSYKKHKRSMSHNRYFQIYIQESATADSYEEPQDFNVKVTGGNSDKIRKIIQDELKK